MYEENDYDIREETGQKERALVRCWKVLGFAERSQKEAEFGFGPVSNGKLLRKTKNKYFKLSSVGTS